MLFEVVVVVRADGVSFQCKLPWTFKAHQYTSCMQTRSPYVSGQAGSARDKNAYSLELTMTYSPGHTTPGNTSSAGPRRTSDRSAATTIPVDSSLRAESPSTPGHLASVHGGMSVLGWPPSPPPPSHTDAIKTGGETSFLELSKNQGSRGSEDDTSAFFMHGERVDSVREEPLAVAEETTQHNEGGMRHLFGSTSASAESTSSEKRRETGKTRPPGAGSVTVANAAIARAKREAKGSRQRLIAPGVINCYRSTGHAPRASFNFDTAQPPSSRMSGVGVAVPRGFSDAR